MKTHRTGALLLAIFSLIQMFIPRTQAVSLTLEQRRQAFVELLAAAHRADGAAEVEPRQTAIGDRIGQAVTIGVNKRHLEWLEAAEGEQVGQAVTVEILRNTPQRADYRFSDRIKLLVPIEQIVAEKRDGGLPVEDDQISC